MEMHQVRYFLAVARTSNFTRAAEECNVSQPSLSRAIKYLEIELGGDLFRRERPRVQLTALGRHMLPLLQQCYESALGARALAQAIRRRSVGSLSIVLSRSVPAVVVLPQIARVRSQFRALRLRLLRADPGAVVETLRAGEAELAVAAPQPDAWNRLDHWPLFEEPVRLLVGRDHRLAAHASAVIEDLVGETVVLRPYCETTRDALAACRARGLALEHCDEAASDEDLVALLASGSGVALAPESVGADGRVAALPIEGFDVRRTVALIGIAGRQRTAAGTALMRLLLPRGEPRSPATQRSA
jgi:DNA-binding transcriptional LysR family regulator